MTFLISGIQQVGIGNPDTPKAFDWYRKNFGFDIPVLNENSEAAQMLPYTEGKAQKRHAILAINLMGGGGLEIWQYTQRIPRAAEFQIHLGDFGLSIAKIRAPDIHKSFDFLTKNGVKIITPVLADPIGAPHFYCLDLFGNPFEIVQNHSIFSQTQHPMGGCFGIAIGVGDMEKAIRFYSKILGYDQVLFEGKDSYADFENFPGGNEILHRVILGHKEKRKGHFSELLGVSQIELIKSVNRAGKKIFENRNWGDLGFIHLCFDVWNMKELKSYCEKEGFPFTVESDANFEMGEAAGQFAYIEDPDGTLIEFVETHKIPILKKIGWYLQLKKFTPTRPLPSWMLKMMKFSRVKNP